MGKTDHKTFLLAFLVDQKMNKRLRESIDEFKLRCFGCYRVTEAREVDLPIDGEDSRGLCKVCGYRSVRLVIRALDMEVVDMLKSEPMS